MRPLREGIQQFLRGDVVARDQSVAVYQNVAFPGLLCDKDQGLILRVEFDPPYRNIKWAYSKRLMFGSLVCLSADRFATAPIWATVFQRELDDLQKPRPSILVQMLDLPRGDEAGAAVPVQYLGAKPAFVMVESSEAFFLPYHSVIKSMQMQAQKAEADNAAAVPFEEHLAGLQKQVEAPAYFHDSPVRLAAPAAAHAPAVAAARARLGRGVQRPAVSSVQRRSSVYDMTPGTAPTAAAPLSASAGTPVSSAARKSAPRVASAL